jgi:hypothetical protein
MLTQCGPDVAISEMRPKTGIAISPLIRLRDETVIHSRILVLGGINAAANPGNSISSARLPDPG